MLSRIVVYVFLCLLTYTAGQAAVPFLDLRFSLLSGVFFGAWAALCWPPDEPLYRPWTLAARGRLAAWAAGLMALMAVPLLTASSGVFVVCTAVLTLALSFVMPRSLVAVPGLVLVCVVAMWPAANVVLEWQLAQHLFLLGSSSFVFARLFLGKLPVCAKKIPAL